MSRSPPAAVARQLRQESGFGCCVCGNPIIQYHHIVEWADEEHFRPEDMMVLCPLHHDQATKGAMPEAEQRRQKLNPLNLRQGRARGLLAVQQNYCAVGVGPNIFVGEGPFLRIDGNDLFECYLGEHNLEISLRLYNRGGDLLAQIVRNEWVSGDPLPWDIEADWQLLTIRERARQISLSINAKEIPLSLQAQFWYGGKYIDCNKKRITIGTNNVSLSGFAFVGMTVAINTDTASIGVDEARPDGLMIAGSDRRQLLWKAKEAWTRIQRLRSAQGRL